MNRDIIVFSWIAFATGPTSGRRLELPGDDENFLEYITIGAHFRGCFWRFGIVKNGFNIPLEVRPPLLEHLL